MVRVYIKSGVNGAGLFSTPIAMAEWVATNVGKIWPLFAGVTGALGAFIAGSNSVSNLMFSAFQYGVAERLMVSGAVIVALQAVGAAAGNMIAIHNVVAASATVGLLGREGATPTLRKMILPTIYYSGVIGRLGLLAIWVLSERSVGGGGGIGHCRTSNFRLEIEEWQPVVNVGNVEGGIEAREDLWERSFLEGIDAQDLQECARI